MFVLSACTVALLLTWSSLFSEAIEEMSASVLNQDGLVVSQSSFDGFNDSNLETLMKHLDEEAWEDEEWIDESLDEISRDTLEMEEFLGLDLGVAQAMDEEFEAEIQERILQARRYVSTVVNVNATFTPEIRAICKNREPDCTLWAVTGECEENSAYTKIHCAPVCFSCDLLDAKKRCAVDPNAKQALYPGDLDKLFERLTNQRLYEHRVLSRPTLAPGDSLETAHYQVGGPWLIVLENFFAEQDALRWIELASLMGYERSVTDTYVQADGRLGAEVNPTRNSTDTWCMDECDEDPITKTLRKKIANITGISETNQEYFQFVRYEENQYFLTHSDYLDHQAHRPMGVRLLTFLLYLTNVEEGGGTNFPEWNITVTPKRGRLFMWPNVLNDQPNVKDPRTMHQSLRVIRGLKNVLTGFVYQGNFKEAYKLACN